MMANYYLEKLEKVNQIFFDSIESLRDYNTIQIID